MKKKKHTLPIELIREILLRLPVRSVLRFKCVCKLWLSLVSDPQFGISHYDLAAAPSHRLLLRSNDFYAQSIDIEAPLEIYYRNVVYFPLPLPSPPCVDHDYDDFHNQPEIFGSCRGIILLYYRGSDDLILWNPTIGVHKRLARSNFIYGIPYEFLFGFGYDVSTDEYLLILIALPEYERVGTEIHIFSFKTESWKMNKNYINVSYEDLEDKFNVEDTFKAGTLFNGALHWLVFSTDKMVPVIIAFDLMQRTLSEIPVSDHVTEYEIYCLREMGGCLSLCCSVRGYEMPEIWVMKEYKVQASWTMSVVTPTYDFSPICITKDGGIFGSNNTGGGRLEKLNDKGELLDYHNYGGGQGLYCANLQSAMYRESLLSLPSVIRATRGYEYGETSEDDHRETSEDDHGGTSEDDHWETSGDDRGETSEDDNRETSENDHGDTSEDDQQ